MISIDLRTIFMNYFSTNIVCFIIILTLWIQTRKRFSGLHYLVLDFLFQVLCMILIFLRGQIPDIFSIVLSNTLATTGALVGLIGIEQFTGIKRRHTFNYMLLFVFVLVQYYFTYIYPEISYRYLNSSIFYLIICGQCAWILLFKTPIHLRSLSRNTGLVFISFSIVNFIRIIEFIIANQHANDYFKSGSFEIFVILSYQILFLLLTFFITLMVNRRLVNVIEIQEKKFSIAFHAVPYAIIISRNIDGKIIEINEGFENISLYNSQESVGKTTIDLNLWANPSERESIMSELAKKSLVKDMEFKFRKKNGELLIGQISCSNIVLENDQCTLSVINDITDRKKSELEIKKSREFLKNLIINLQTEHEEEKINLATEIDNTLNQNLIALQINVGLLKRNLTNDSEAIPRNLIELINKVYLEIGKITERSLNLMNHLRNEVLYLLGLNEAISYYLEEVKSETGIHCEFLNNENFHDIDKTLSSSLFKIIHDIIYEIIQVKCATKISVELDIIDNKIHLTITENGNSFSHYLNNLDNENFIHSLKEKSSIFEGTLKIQYNQKNNTEIQIIIPVP